MKYVILIGDGMGDYPLAALGHKTILETARTPNMDALAQDGLLGVAQTVPPEKEPGSDVANMAVMGYDPVQYHTGRGPLEAAAMGVALQPHEVAFRLNFVTLDVQDDGTVYMRDHAAGDIDSRDAAELVEALNHQMLTGGLIVHPGVSYRNLLVWPDLPGDPPTQPPHDHRDQDVTWYVRPDQPELEPIAALIRSSWPILDRHPINQRRRSEGLRPANSIWPWGQGRPPAMPSFQDRFGLTGAAISAVDLIKGLGVYAGLTPVDVPGATGLVDTNYQGKVDAALQVLEQHDFVLVHVEAPDEAGHQGDVETKIEAVQRFDERVVGPIWKALREGGDYRLMVLCDHYTPIEVKTHTREPVPFVVYPAKGPSSGRVFSEKEAQATGVVVDPGYKLIEALIR
jgi:2,3-bisphosphoglycerate-independent phosphoglycerate mutase